MGGDETIEQFIKIPVEFLRLSNDDLGIDKLECRIRLMVYIFLEVRVQTFGNISFTLDEFGRFLGINGNSAQFCKGKTYQTGIRELEKYIKSECLIIDNGRNLSDFKMKQQIKAVYSGVQPYKISEARFIKLTQFEYNVLIKESGNRTIINELFVYLFIKSWIYIRPTNSTQTTTDHPEYCHLSQTQLSEGCNLSLTTISKTVEQLVNKYKLIAREKPVNIRKKNIPFIDNNNYLNISTVYVLRTEGWEEELQAGMNKYINQIATIHKCN